MATTLKTNIGRKIGSAESRRLVATDHIPAVIYGHGMVPVKITVERRDLRVALAGPAGVNTILELQVGDAKYPAIVKELQRDPVKRVVRHIDFMQISLTELITMDIPVQVTGIAKAVLSDAAHCAAGHLFRPKVFQTSPTSLPFAGCTNKYSQ